MQCPNVYAMYANMAVSYQPKILIVLSLLIIMPGVCSTHILLEYSLPVEPKEAKTVNTQQQYFDFANFFYMFAAPIYWCTMVSSTNVLVH